MEDAKDKFFNGYLKRNMAKIVTKVKVREIVPHLPSLTQSDQENIEAKRENTGNYNAMQLLLSCLRRKHSWLEEFITGLQTCGYSSLASQIQEEFNCLKIQPNGSTLTPMALTSGGTLQPPRNCSTISSPKMDEAADLATTLPPEAISGDGILASYTGPSSAVVQSQSPLEPVAVLQTHTTEDIRTVPSTTLVMPISHISSPEVPPPVPLMKPIDDSNPPDKKLHSASVNPADSSKSTVGQALAKDLLLGLSVVSPTENVAGVTASLNVQDATDGLISPSYVGGASAGEEVRSNKPVLLTSIHSVQVHQPFDSPSTFPPIPSAYSGNSVNLECSSNLSHNTSESVNAGSIVLNDAENVVPSIADCVVLSDAETGAPSNVFSVAVSDVETVAIDDDESVALGHAESETLSDTDMVAPGEAKNVALCETERVAPADEESEAFCDAENVAPHDAGGVFSGDIKSAFENVESFLPENKNTIVPRNEESIAPDNVVSGNNEKVTINAKSLVGDNTEIGLCYELEQRPDPESRAENDYCDSIHHNITTSNHNPECEIHNTVAPSNMQNRAADIMETTAPCSMESTAFMDLETRDHNFTLLPQNDCDIGHQEVNSPDTPTSNDNSESFLPVEADNGVLGEGDSEAPGRRDCESPCEGNTRAQVKSEIGTLCNTDSGVPAEGHSDTSSEDYNGDKESEAPGVEDNGASSNTDSGAPGERDIQPPGDTDSGAPGNGDASGDGDGVSPGEGDSGAPGESDNGVPGDEGSQAAEKEDSGGPHEEDNVKSADRDPGKIQSGVLEEGDGVIPEEGESREPEVRNTGSPIEGESREPAEGGTDTTPDIDSGAPDEVGIVAPSCTELPQYNTEGNQDFNHFEVSFPASFSKHIPKNIVPSDVESATTNVVQSTTQGHLKNGVHSDIEPTHKELVENQNNSTHIEISLPSSALSNDSPDTVAPKGTECITPGNTEPLHLEAEENHCSSVHLKVSLSPAESFTPSTDSGSPNSIGSQSPADTSSSPNKEPAQKLCSSTHLTINLTSPVSLNRKPDSVSDIDMESHTHKPMIDHCSASGRDITDEQEVEKKELCMSEDLDFQIHTTPGAASVGFITEKGRDAFPEQGQSNNHSLLRNYYVPATVAGVVAAAMLWQLKK